MITPSGYSLISNIDLYSSETNASTKLGSLVQTADGRKFRYVKCGATVTVTGDCYSAAAQDAQFESMANNAIVAIGGTSIAVTNGTTTVAANDFDEGYLLISSSVGIGQSSQIVSHDTGASGATITYKIADPLAVALSTASKVTTVKNPHDDIVITNATPVAIAVGIAQFAIPTTKYGWLQTGGPAAALFDAGTNTTIDLISISPSSTTNGSVQASTSTVTQVIGSSIQVVSVDSYVGPVFLTID